MILKDTLDAVIADKGLVPDHLEFRRPTVNYLHTGEHNSIVAGITLHVLLATDIKSLGDAKPASSKVQQAGPSLHPALRQIENLPLIYQPRRSPIIEVARIAARGNPIHDVQSVRAQAQAAHVV